MPTFQALTVGDRIWLGMDTYTDPNKIADGYAQRITNLVVQNGSLVQRRGFQCQTTTPISGSYWSSISIRSGKNTSSTAVLVGESNGSLDAGFWKFDANHGNAVPIPMSASGTLTFSNIEPDRVRMIQFGRYIYVAPGAAATGTDNYPLRIDTNTKSQKLSGVTIGTDQFTFSNHGLVVGDPFVITSVLTGSLPGTLAINTVYFVTYVNGNNFRVAASLPTTTTTSVTNITFAAPSPTCTVDIVTTLKGETVPVAVGLTDNSPIAEPYPFIGKSIPSSNVYNIISNGVALGSTAQMLSNADFTGTNNVAPASWTQFVTSGTRTVTVKTATPPNSTADYKILIDDNSDAGIFPGVYQQVTPVTDTTTLFNGSVSATCLMYRFVVRAIHFDQITTPRRRPIAVRVRGMKLSGASYVAIDGCVVEEIVNLQPTTNPDGYSIIDVLADFRDFKDELTTSGKIQVEIQAAADFGVTSGSYAAFGLYVDYAYLYPHASVAKTSTLDTAVDSDTKLVRMRATSLNTNTTAYAGYVRDRHFYYDVTSTYTVTLNASAVHTATSPTTAPENGTPVSFTNIGTVTGISINTTYYVVNSIGSSFGLSATYGGSAITLGGTLSTGRTMTAGLYLKKADSVSCQFYLNPQFLNQNPSFTVGLQNGTSTSITWGSIGGYSQSAKYLTFSLSSFAKSDLDNVKAIYIRCNNDFFVSNAEKALPISQSTILFYIGNLVYNGELQNQGLYEYSYSRWKSAPAYTPGTSITSFSVVAPWTSTNGTNTYFGGVESPLSKVSVPLRANEAESRIKVTLSASDFKDASGAGYTHLLIYRRNSSTFPDGRFRCIGQVDISGASPSLASSSANIKLDTSISTSTNIVLIDNVGDSELLFDKPLGQTGYVYRDGKDFFPIGCENVTVHQQRVWFTKANTLFASWLLDTDNEYSIHTTIVPIATDPSLPVKGASFDISSNNDYEPITALVSFSGEGLSKNNSSTNALLVLRNNSILPVLGSDASSFSVLGFVREAGAGCIAPLCAQTVNGRVWWLSNSGISQYSDGLPEPMSKALDRLVNARNNNPLFNPTSGSLTIDQSLQRTSCGILFDKKFIFTSAQPGGTAVTTLFVFDTTTGGWFEWSFPQPTSGSATQPRSMFVFDSNYDAPELFVAGSNGHIYKYTGTQDKHTTSLSSFDWALLTRQYGQTYSQGQAYYAINRVHQLDLHVDTSASLATNWRIYNQTQPQLISPTFNNPAFTFYSSGTWTFNAGNRSAAIRNIKKDMRGISYSVQLSGTSLSGDNYFRIFGILLHVNEGGIRRVN